MRWLSIVWICALLPCQMPIAAEKGGWKTYRSDKFGYELSFPPEMEYKVYLDGSSGDLMDVHSGNLLVSFEVWPPDECPRQPDGTTAKDVGIEHVKGITQADGADSSSSCGDPLRIWDVASVRGVKIYELELTCVTETSSVPDDDEIDVEPNSADIDEPITTVDGKKWPTFFIDISQPWRKRILTADPSGNDPRIAKDRIDVDLNILRTILANITTFPVPKPPGICIEDLRGRTFTSAIPVPSPKPD